MQTLPILPIHKLMRHIIINITLVYYSKSQVQKIIFTLYNLPQLGPVFFIRSKKLTMMPRRTKESYQKSVYDFIKDIYVVCPSCGGQAIIKTPEFSFGKKNEKEIKLICTNCGHSKRLEEKPDDVLHATAYKKITGKYVIIGGAIDPYFHLPLWLTVACCDNVLWAYNYEHIEFLGQHVAAKLRERNTVAMANKSLGSRLPKWMVSKKNRETILKALIHLKNKN